MGEESWKASVRESFKTWKQDSTRRAIRQYFNSVQVSIRDNASVYTVKKGYCFSRDVTNQTLPGRELLNYSRLGRVWLVTSRLETGKTINFCSELVDET
jgi:hypothetical protein